MHAVVVGATLLSLTGVLLVAALVVLVSGRRRYRGNSLPTSVTGTVFGLPVLAFIAGAYGFVALVGVVFAVGVATNLG